MVFILSISTSGCEDNDPIDDLTDDKSSSSENEPIVLFDETKTLDDGDYITYQILESGTFKIKITVDNNDGLELYYNGTYEIKVINSYSQTKYFDEGDLVKLENDTILGLGDSISYSIYIGE